MVDIDLSSVQKRALRALVTSHRDADRPVTAGELADDIDRKPRTVGEVMRGLQDLSLVESKEGPAGGYVPTDRAAEVVAPGADETADTVTLAHEYERLDVTVDEIDLIAVHDPERCRARFHLARAVHDFEAGDAVAVGPTLPANLVVAGEVVAVDEENGELLIEVAQIETLGDGETV